MKYSTVIVALAASFASAAPAGENLEKRGGGALCLAICAPTAPVWAGYAACLAACVASGVEGDPVEAEKFIQNFMEEQEQEQAKE